MSKQSNKDLYFAIRDLGYRPRIKHWRYLNSHQEVQGLPVELDEIRKRSAQNSIIAKGGVTSCTLVKDDTQDEIHLYDEEVARCSPKDNYNKKIGVHIALARALEYLKNANSSTGT